MLRAPHQVHRTVAATGLNITDTRDQQRSRAQLGPECRQLDNLILTEMPHGLASRMRITPLGRAHSRLTVTKRATRPYELGSWSHHIRGTWE